MFSLLLVCLQLLYRNAVSLPAQRLAWFLVNFNRSGRLARHMKAEGKQVEVDQLDTWVATFQVVGSLVVADVVAGDVVVDSLVVDSLVP